MNIRFVKLILLSVCMGLTVSVSAQSKRIETYRNPVIQGDFPDPTVIRVNNDYFAAGTSTDFVPSYPLFHSTDLINWDQIGFIFNTPPEWTNGCFWAPELFYNNGTYFVYYTAKRKTDNVSCIGVATTKDIKAGFKDHGVLIEWDKEAIDAYVFKDDDGKLYISWKAYGLNPDRPIELLASELSSDGLSLKGEHFSLTRPDKGWIERGDEGQCMVKHGGYYYLFYSIGGCCDNKCTYNTRIARSKSLKGDWEQYETEALLEGGGEWICSGHGTIVQTPDHRYFYLYHAYNATDFEFIGRQGLLDELLWDETTGWPYFKYGNKPSAQAEVPFKGTIQKREPVFVDDFTTRKGKFWQWDMKSPSLFSGIRPQSGDYEMETGVIKRDKNTKGLCIYGDRDNLLALGVNLSELVMYQVKDGKKEVLSSAQIPSGGTVFLRAESITGRLFRFFWSTDQQNWTVIQDKNGNPYINGIFIPRWGVGLRAGLIDEGKLNPAGTFSYFRLTNK